MAPPEPLGRSVHFVHIGDSHVRDGDDDEHLARLATMCDEIRRLEALGVPIDFVVHTGDLVDTADEPDATIDLTRQALDLLSGIGVPWYVLAGNHDRRAFLAVASMRAAVSAPHPDAAIASGADSAPPIHPDDLPALHRAGVSRRVHGTLEALFLNANPEDGERDLHGAIVAAQIDALADHLDALPTDRSAAVFLHYPPLDQQTAWAGRPLGGEALHRALTGRAARLAGVFAGHVHRGVTQLRDGVLYASVPALSRGFDLWPGLGHGFDDLPTIGYHYVSTGPEGTRVQARAALHRSDGAMLPGRTARSAT